MTRFIQTIAIRLGCAVFLVITAVFYITVLVSSAFASSDWVEDTMYMVSEIEEINTLALIVEPENTETIATSTPVTWMTGLIEVDLDRIVRVPCRAT